MLPYGVIINENRLTIQHALIVWQRNFGVLKPSVFIKKVFLPLALSIAAYFIGAMFLDKYFTVEGTLISAAVYGIFLGIFMYTSAMKTVKEYAVSFKDRKVQIVLKEETLEVVTEFSKEIIYYNEIDLCHEKNFLVTLIYDKGNFPLSISKMNFIRGDYDTFVSILKNKLPGRYVKKGEN